MRRVTHATSVASFCSARTEGGGGAWASSQLLASRRLASTLLARESLRLGPPRPPSPRCASPGLVTALLACKLHRPLLARLGRATLGLLVMFTPKPL